MKIKILNFIVISFLMALPYMLFNGKLYVGGDDTRLFYSYPAEFLQHAVFVSWYNFSALGINIAAEGLGPLLGLWYILEIIIGSKVVISYFAFSLPLILGFIYFQKFFSELLTNRNDSNFVILIGSLFYIFSPILMYDQLFIFLTPVWLIGSVPMTLYYFIKFVKEDNFIYVLKFIFLASFILLLNFAIPWAAGLLLPLCMSLIVGLFLFSKNEILFVIKKFIIFSSIYMLSQFFWFLSFSIPILNLQANNFFAKAFSSGFVDSFAPTVKSTASGTIIYPLLNLFHRQVAFDFTWDLKNVFINFYDKFIILDCVFILILFMGIIYYKNKLSRQERRVFLIILFSFILSLYFFTVNIGPLRDLFLIFGNIPGFTMFRNFYDKFSVGYVFFYSVLITFSLLIIKRKLKNVSKYIFTLFIIVVCINFSSIDQVVNSPLWKTTSIYRNISIPDEYLSFMRKIRDNVSSTNTILSLPFGSSAYSVIKEKNSNNAYIGISPVILFSGVNDISGHLSFNYTKEAEIVDGIILKREYPKLNKILNEHNINYILLTKNIPDEIKNTYVFNLDLLDKQDNEFIEAITSKKLFVSSEGNYELYKAKNINSLINSKNVSFQKIYNVKYKIYLKNLNQKQVLSFLDSFHPGWNLYLQKNPSLGFCKNPIKNSDTNTTECKPENKLFEVSDLIYSTSQSIFGASHSLLYGYANKWEIDPDFIKENFDKSFYKVNKDGSLDIELILYFTPQNYFYIGTLISIATFLSVITYIFIKKRNEKKK